MFYNESSYYRANPFHKQGYLPDRAFVNRKLPDHLVELPQGDSHFEPSRRRYYNQNDRSEIQQNGLLNHPDPEIKKASMVLQKDFARNLTTQDIEGAVANSYMSPVVRNRLKSLQIREQSGSEFGPDALTRANTDSPSKLANNPARPPNPSFLTTNQEEQYRNKIIAEQMKQNKELTELMRSRNFHSNRASTQNVAPTKLPNQPPQVYRNERVESNQHVEHKMVSQPASDNYRQPDNYRPQYRGVESYPSQNYQDKPTIQYENPVPQPAHQYKPVAETIDSSKRSMIEDRKNVTPLLDLQSLRYNNQRSPINEPSSSSRLNSRAGEQLKSERSVSTPYKSIQAADYYGKKVTPTYLSYASNPFNYAAKNMLKQ